MTVSNFWNGKQVIVTGACGMVGSRLCAFLRDEGAFVFGLDDMSRGRHKEPGVNYDLVDCTDAAEWMRVVQYRNIKPEAIFNLAASVGGVYYNQHAQYRQFVENMALQTVPAQVAAELGVDVFLQVSSVCVYATGFNNPAIEEYGHHGQPEPANEGYAWAKRMGEHAARWALEGTGTRLVIVRPTNMYGVRDYFDDRAHVIPALIRKFIELDNFTVYGGHVKREFLYADDGARGMMAAAEHGHDGEVYNLGTSGDTQITIAHLANLIYALTGSDADVTIDCNSHTGDLERRTDSSKAQALGWLGWRHKVGIKEGLENVIEWYQRRNQS